MSVQKLHIKERIALEPSFYLPAISIVLPFEPKTTPKAQLEAQFKHALINVERELHQYYSKFLVRPAMQRLKQIINKVDYSTHRKSIAIFLAPFTEKIYYLNIPVKEKIAVSEEMKVREIIANKKEEQQYLVLVLNNKGAQIYLGNAHRLNCIVCNTTDRLSSQINKVWQQKLNFFGFTQTTKVLSAKFLKHIDKGLGIILKSYSLPLVVISTKETFHDFKQHSKNIQHIVECQHVVEDYMTETAIQEMAAQCIANWKRFKQKHLLQQLDEALNNNRLAVGISEVWRTAKERKTKLLVVEKDYVFPACLDEVEEMMFADDTMDGSLTIRDAVDDAIEKVLAEGGNVELVENGALKDYLHIALVC